MACNHSLLDVRYKGLSSPRRALPSLHPSARRSHVRAAATKTTQGIQSLKEVAQKYEAVLLDQFGVLHDGHEPYPGAVDAVRGLHEAGVSIIIISNSSRRASGTAEKLAKMGFEEDWFTGTVTSGELTHQQLLRRPGPWWQALGDRCIHITWTTRGKIDLSELNLQVVVDPAEADFILAHGTQGLAQPDGSVQDMEPPDLFEMLERCAVLGMAAAATGGKELPLIVANPDLVTVDGAKGLIMMPGTLGAAYERFGGKVRLMGKPDAAIYRAALDALGVTPDKVLAIGDSMQHDIAGARNSGIDTLFIAGGIHAGDLSCRPRGSSGASTAAADNEAEGGSSSALWDESALLQLCLEYKTKPTYTMPFLVW